MRARDGEVRRVYAGGDKKTMAEEEACDKVVDECLQC